MDSARRIQTTVKLDGLPTLLVSGEPWPPEPEVGISWWTVEDLTWRGAECELTPEQDLTVYEHSREIEDAVVEELQARKAAAWGGAL